MPLKTNRREQMLNKNDEYPRPHPNNKAEHLRQDSNGHNGTR